MRPEQSGSVVPGSAATMHVPSQQSRASEYPSMSNVYVAYGVRCRKRIGCSQLAVPVAPVSRAVTVHDVSGFVQESTRLGIA
jgi:hypothetical protein